MNLGLVCMRKGRGFKKGFTGKKAINKAIQSEVNSKLYRVTLYNLKETISNIQYCIDNNISSYRISSSIIPFYEYWDWESFIDILGYMQQANRLAKSNNITLTIHPDQYTVINSNNPKVVENSFDILEHHRVLCQYIGIEHVILHTGGIYGDKSSAMDRFVDNFNKLPKSLQSLIRLENCHYYNIDEVLSISKRCGVDVCYDFHHERVINNNIDLNNHIDNINKCIANNSNMLVCHISSGKEDRYDKSHHNYIIDYDIKLFKKVLDKFSTYDIMVEVEAKYKELAIKKIREGVEW